jgi:VWFA-related protein
MARAAILLIFSILLRAQTPPKEVSIRSHPYIPPSAILRAETNLVQAGLIARDSNGHAIAGLHPSDFEVLDNGVPQKITAFSELRSDGKPAVVAPSEILPPAAVPPPEPKFVTFFFDDYHLENAGMLFVVRAAHAFIRKGVKPGDKLSIVTASSQGDLDFTDDQKLFAEKLDHLASHARPMMIMPCGVSQTESYIVANNLDYQTIERAIAAATPCACGGPEKPMECRAKALGVANTLANSSWEQTQALSVDTIDALDFAAKRLAQMNGMRILVLTSSGFLIRPGQPELEKFIAGATRWNIVVHALDANGLQAGANLLHQSFFWMALEKVTDGTNGHFFKNSNDLAAAMDLASNPEVTYVLAFNPGPRDGKFHTLKIRFKSKRPDSIQFRPSYFSPADQPDKTQLARAPLDAAVFSKEALSDVPASVRVDATNASASITITVDVNGLQFTTANGRHAQQIVFLITLLDPSGAFVTGKEAIMDLALTDERLASLQKEGLKAVATLSAPAGEYQVRTIVREAMKGHLAASTIPIELR